MKSYAEIRATWLRESRTWDVETLEMLAAERMLDARLCTRKGSRRTFLLIARALYSIARERQAKPTAVHATFHLQRSYEQKLEALGRCFAFDNYAAYESQMFWLNIAIERTQQRAALQVSLVRAG